MRKRHDCSRSECHPDRGDDPDVIASVYDKLHSTWVGVLKGQYIIRGLRGEYYPCDPEVFLDSYEEVTDG